MKKLLLGALVALLPLTGFSATILGFQVGGGSWKHDPSGTITSSSGGLGTSADLKNDLNLAEKSEGYTYFSIEHPIPLVPNVKFVSTKLDSSGSGTVASSFDFNGTTYSTSASVTSSLILDQTDTTLYYEVLDNVVSLDIGLTAKKVDGKASVKEGANPTISSTFSGTIPMLYAAAEISLPSGFTLAGEINTISSGDDKISDVTAKITYTTDFMLGVEAGVRTQSIKINEDSVATDIEFSGIFAGVYFKF